MARQHLYVIEVADGDPVTVEKYNNTGVGAEFTDDGVTTMIPWSQVTRIRRVDAADLRRLADPDDDAEDVPAAVRDVYDCLPDDDEIPAEPDPGPDARTVEAPPTDADGQPLDTDDEGTDDEGGGGGEVDTKAGRARESGGTPKAADVRAWAKSQNIEVPAQGPVPDSVKAAYAAAHTD